MFNKILCQIQDRYKITGKDLAAAAGISPQHFSEFRRGKVDLTTRALWNVLEALDTLAPGAKAEFAAEISGFTIESFVKCANDQEIASLLVLIGNKLKNSDSSEITVGAEPLTLR